MLTRTHSILLFSLLVWLAACYGVRFGLMENRHWLDLCDNDPTLLACQTRAYLGLMIHFKVLPWIGLLSAVPAFLLAGPRGRILAWIGLFSAAPALALYTVTPAVFAALLSGLRLVRNERHSANANSADAPAQPSA